MRPALLTLLLLATLPALAQKRITLHAGCAFDHAVENATPYTFEPDAQALKIVAEICRAIGVEQGFILMASDVKNAIACELDGKRYVLYNNNFLADFQTDARTRWAAYGVLAHEIGHHHNFHNFNEPSMVRRKEMELQADRFTGSVLRMLGATKDEARAAVSNLLNKDESATHPPASARSVAVVNGWNDRDNLLRDMGITGSNTPGSGGTAPIVRDRDGDGVPDGQDACPDVPGEALLNGCPDADGDGITDADDACPYKKGEARWKGCPDSDGDGIPDNEDQCPFVRGELKDRGCPPADRDNDGIPDTADRCPDQPGTARFRGCPDTDGDGVPDPDDKCPDQKGDPVYDGCPVPTTPTTPASSLPAGFARISGGTYNMGCTSEQKDCDSDESPVTKVTVSDFYIGKHEVTFDEYDAFCTATGREKPSDQGWGRGQRPVINISWNDAVAYCNWRSEKENLSKVYTISGSTVTANWNANGYRLPTEAEWEYAARGGGKAVLFGNGKNVADPREINFDASSSYKKDYSIAGEYRKKTVPVGSLNSPNGLGLHDMSGNVWEWCWDWHTTYPGGERNNYRGPDSGSYRVCRGGSWDSYPQYVRVANRIYFAPDNRNRLIGFRLARAVR